MLPAPRADFLESEALKLSSASDTFRHVYVEEYQHSEKMWGAPRSSFRGRIRARCSLRLAGGGLGERLVNGLGFARHVVHQQILPKRIGSGEVRLAAAHLGDFLHELYQAIIRGQHESIDQDARPLALGNF